MEKRFSIIVPYRDRERHLSVFIPHMRSRFKKAEILIIEQADKEPFNRGKLLNVGSLLATGDYLVHHDVDMLPIKADYSAPVNPTHLATKVSQFRYKLPFAEYFGGVVMFSHDHFKQVNGYSNNFKSWGAEDNEMYNNVLANGLKIDRRQCTFESLHHTRHIDKDLYPKNVELLAKGRQPEDGLTHCKYEIVNKTDHANYIKLSVRI